MDDARVSRRRVLCILSGGAAATSGCLSYIPGVGAPEFGVPPEDVDCPFLDDDVGRAVSSEMYDAGEAPLGLSRSRRTLELPRDDATFELHNGTQEEFNHNRYSWRIWKRVDDEWFHIVPRGSIQPLHRLAPGDVQSWTLTLDGDAYREARTGLENLPDDVVETETGYSSNPTVAGVGAGEYAFETDGWFDSGSHEQKMGFCAKFTVDGGPLELSPTVDAVAERDGDTVTVTLEGEEPEENERRAVFVVSRVGDPPSDEVERLIPEQVIRWRRSEGYAYRNTLSYLDEGVETVRYERYDGVHPPFGLRETRYIEYEGDTFEVETEELENSGGADWVDER